MSSTRDLYQRPIDNMLALWRERQAVITALDREAIETVSHDTAAAVRLAMLASELRRKTMAEIGL